MTYDKIYQNGGMSMNEIKCPNCGNVFKIDESQYYDLLKQVKDKEFEKELKEREKSSNQILKAQLEKDYETKLNEKSLEIHQLHTKLEGKVQEKEKEILSLQEQLKSNTQLTESKTKSEYQNILNNKDLEIAKLQAQLDKTKQDAKINENLSIQEYQKKLEEKEKTIISLQTQMASSQEITKANTISEYQEKLNAKELEIQSLKQSIEKNAVENNLKLTTATKELEDKNIELTNSMKQKELAYEIKEKSLTEKYENMLKYKDEEIERYKDFRLQQHTKVIGESLEQYCHDEFDNIRFTAFPNAYFEKDNKNSKESGSKGDFIFRDYLGDFEYVSIMFEMKNQDERTKAKKKNEDFFKELDKDRNEKGCEYAVLVSMLEEDSHLYNQGIVNVSHRYPKMYVVRPQFFIPIITLIRDGALNAATAKRELMDLRNQNLDITHFEDALIDFQTKFGKNYASAANNFQKALDEIDATITKLNNIKSALTTTSNQLRYANDKAQDLSIKKLTRKNPTMKAKFEELKKVDNVNK